MATVKDTRPQWLKDHDKLMSRGRRCDCIGCYAYTVGMIDKPKVVEAMKPQRTIEELLK